MSRVSRSGNVRAIRPGVAIPMTNAAEDETAITLARAAAISQRRAYELAQTEPNSTLHRSHERLARLSETLPCNRLRLIVTPTTPRQEWFSEAKRLVHIARCERDLACSRWSHAYTLDQWDRGERHLALEAERNRTEAALKQAIEDALRTPTTRRADALAKQDMIGKREWAVKYRPEWQAIIDEDVARFPVRSRKAAKKEAQA